MGVRLPGVGEATKLLGLQDLEFCMRTSIGVRGLGVLSRGVSIRDTGGWKGGRDGMGGSGGFSSGGGRGGASSVGRGGTSEGGGLTVWVSIGVSFGCSG